MDRSISLMQSGRNRRTADVCRAKDREPAPRLVSRGEQGFNRRDRDAETSRHGRKKGGDPCGDTSAQALCARAAARPRIRPTISSRIASSARSRASGQLAHRRKPAQVAVHDHASHLRRPDAQGKAARRGRHADARRIRGPVGRRPSRPRTSPRARCCRRLQAISPERRAAILMVGDRRLLLCRGVDHPRRSGGHADVADRARPRRSARPARRRRAPPRHQGGRAMSARDFTERDIHWRSTASCPRTSAPPTRPGWTPSRQ